MIGGNKVVVRSIASGSPRGSFMGMELDGTRSFKIDTICYTRSVTGRSAHPRLAGSGWSW
ncbi:MAG: hypothetical protein E6J90_38790 [Deltaproteobacteria bacterium]|nr:MAG: hypothetical protein E6J90_38790 [Deltaproteobacteria bacterium]